MKIEAPQSFIVHSECEKATYQNGFRRALGVTDGWAAFSSTTVPGRVFLAAEGAQGPWFLALDHPGVIEALDMPACDQVGPGLVRFRFDVMAELYPVLSRVYQLAASLPDAPLREFTAKVRNLPQSTVAERLVVQRVGQDIFRASLMEYWQGRCPLTGIADTALLRASHIVPWSACESDAERLDVHNGILLSALWDAAFDKGLVSFTDDGVPLFSTKLSDVARAELRWKSPLCLTLRHRKQLVWHRENVFQVDRQ